MTRADRGAGRGPGARAVEKCGPRFPSLENSGAVPMMTGTHGWISRIRRNDGGGNESL